MEIRFAFRREQAVWSGDLASLFGELDCFRSGDLFEVVRFQFLNYHCIYVYIYRYSLKR